MFTEDKNLKDKCSQLNLAGYKRHIFLCAGPKCCDSELGERVWLKLKDLCVSYGIVNKTALRTKASCLRVCCNGLVAVVYPEGVWYKNINMDNIETIVSEHLVCGRIVEELVLAINKNL